MLNQFSRTELLIGKDGLEKLKNSKIAVFGIGGVGSFVVEGLARSGIGNFVLIDNDTICLTNLNRQIHATTKTIGMYKVDAMKQRILDINPDANIENYKEFYLPESKIKILNKNIDYIVDAIDTVTTKVLLACQARDLEIPIISAMGTGNKLDPTRFEVTDIYKTSMCPLAKIMRKKLKENGVKKLKVVYSKEEPIKPYYDEIRKEEKVKAGSISFVPSVVGMIIAGEVIKDILKK
mgnify:FL=1